ncbi:hypothetical protein B7494_g824 [Chlorociboria aeruginascens]|nr:hypothetical protein B7494_g824 [Chlorociboria aeruginascens]
MVSLGHVGLRSLQFIWTLLITALIGNVIARQGSSSNSAINYAIFTAVFSWIVLLYGLIAGFIEALAIPIALIAMDGLAILFTFIAGVVLAAKLRVHSCSNTVYLDSNSLIKGSGETCKELQASTAFFWFLFATFIASAAVSGLSARGSGMSSRGGIRRGGPSMSQV